MYPQFIRFLAPLVIATLAFEIGGQFLNGGMARIPRATETLAAFGLANGLTRILAGPLYQTRQLALAMVDNRTQLRVATRTVVAGGVILAGLTAALGLDGPGRWVVLDLHGIAPSLAKQAQLALLLLAPLQLVDAMVRYISGLLARFKRTEVISASNIAGIVVRVVSVFMFLDASFVQRNPILLPVAITWLASTVEVAILFWGHFRFARPQLPDEGAALSIPSILRFLWPLALIMTFQGFSRPLINLVVSRGPDATQALAVLTIVYALGHIHYGWVNEIRSLAPAFRDEENSLQYIRRFVIACCAISFMLALFLFWTPVRTFILLDLIGVDSAIADLCMAPLIIFSFFPFAVTLRGYYHGIGIVRRITGSMAASGPSRLTAIVIALVVFSFTDIPGATRGIGALFFGFAAESLVVSWGVRRKIRLGGEEVNV